MARSAAHRGPDGIHYWTNGSAGLSHLACHLAPASQVEQQPLAGGHNLVLTADARVDNREELIRALTAKKFLTDGDPTDARLILAAYQCWKTDCTAHLIGDYAFVILEPDQRRVFAARDAMAMRPLYYRAEPNRFLVASEVKQILAVPGVPREIFEPAVAAHLAGKFEHLEWTFYAGIAQLPPGHALVADPTGCRVWRYWDVDPDSRIEYADEDQYAEHFRELFKDAVRCRLRTAKPVGFFLSGGMDSGSAASTAGWLVQHRALSSPPSIRAYCWAFEELAECDERHISDAIVGHYGFPSTNVPADSAWPLKNYPAHGPDMDEPFVGVYQALIERTLAAAQADGVGVMLSGDRGDLMMGSWVPDYLGCLRAGQIRALWDDLQSHARWSEEDIGTVFTQYLLRPLLRAGWRRVRLSLRGVPAPSSAPYPPWVRPQFATSVGLEEIGRESNPPANVTGFARGRRYQAIFAPMHMRSMVWSERTQARFGLGFADPWSDRRIASFVLAVPQPVIARPGGGDKPFVRRAMRGIMPEAVRLAARKIVPYPLYRHALENKARQTVMDLMSESQSAARGYVDPSVLRSHFESICRGERDHHCFWWALTLEMWLRNHWAPNP